MKLYIRSSQIDKSSIVDAVVSEFGRENPGPGNTYIAEDGTFIQLYPRIDDHADLCEWIEEELGQPIEYHDAEYAVNEFNWVRLRKDPFDAVIELTVDRPTNSQMLSLEDWLIMLEDSEVTSITIGVFRYRGLLEISSFNSEYFAEDIMKIVRKYYATHRLEG